MDPVSRRSRLARSLEAAVEAVVGACARRPRAALAWIAAVTIALGAGLPFLRFETGILDWLPRHHENVRAFSRLLEKLDGITNQELLWVELDSEKAAAAGVESITDPRAIRAAERLVSFVRERVPRIRHVFGLPHWVSLVDRANRGESGGEVRLPDSDAEIAVIYAALAAANRTLLEPTLSKDGRGTLLGLVVDGNPLEELARETGREIEEAVAAYRREVRGDLDLFDHDFLVPVGLASGTSLIDRSLRRDVAILLPLAVALVAAILLAAFRRPRAVVIALSALLLGVVWTCGLMGYCGAPLNVVNVALVPLLLGCGIDYAIHVLAEFAHGRAAGASREATLRTAARSSGVGVVLTTVTTVAGLLTLVLSDSPGMTALGAFAAFGMASLAAISLTFIPASLVLAKERAERPPAERGGGATGAAMGALARHRLAALALFASLTAALAAAAGDPVYLLDVIEGNYGEDEPIARAVRRMKERAGGAFPEFLIVEGDMTDPASVREVDALKERVLAAPAFRGRMRAASFADALGTYEILKNGSVAAVPALLRARGSPANAIPGTREAIVEALAAMDGDPGWRPLSSLFGDPKGSMALVILIAGEGWGEIAAAADLWKGLEEVAATAPPGLRVSFLGYRTMSYLFVSYSLHWLRVLFAVSAAVVLVLVAVFVREAKALATVGALAVTTGVWWLGLLHARGIFISIFLLFPLVFVVCIGSDFGVHLVWRLSRGEERASVWRGTGRAIALSAATTGSVFALFSTMRLVSAAQVMEAVALAVAAVFAATVILVPAVYGENARDAALRSGRVRIKQ